MSDVRWEPVERTGYTDDRGGLLRVHTDDDGTQYISATSSEITESGWVKMPDTPAKLRLCRAVSVEPVTWSQEPPSPDDEIEWWYWLPSMKKPQRVIVFSETLMIEISQHGAIYTIHDAAWWLPATVPQPPGEVGP